MFVLVDLLIHPQEHLEGLALMLNEEGWSNDTVPDHSKRALCWPLEIFHSSLGTMFLHEPSFVHKSIVRLDQIGREILI